MTPTSRRGRAFTPTLLPIDGQEVPVLGEAPPARVAPALLSGHGVAAAHEVVLGPVTLAQLHKKLGQTVVLTSGGLLPPQHLQVVGTATVARLWQSGQHLEMGVGAVLSVPIDPGGPKEPVRQPPSGASRRPGALAPRSWSRPAYRSLERIAAATSNPENFGVSVVGVQHPAEILNYRSLGHSAYWGQGWRCGRGGRPGADPGSLCAPAGAGISLSLRSWALPTARWPPRWRGTRPSR